MGSKLSQGIGARNQLFAVYRSVANKRQCEFSLTKENFAELTSSNCIYCGIRPTQKHHPKFSNGAYFYNGLDRLDNAKGYSVTNCVPCCYTCNHAKGTMSYLQFLDWLNRLVIYRSDKT